MHEVDISPVAVQVVNIDLPIVTGTTGAEAVRILSDAMAYAPTVTAVRHALVTAIKAGGSGIVYRPVTVTGATGAAVTISVPYIPSTAIARPPMIGADQTVDAVIATATGDAIAPAPVGVGDALVVAPKATATANAKVPVVTGGISVSVTAVIANSSAVAKVPVVPLLDVTVNAVVAKTNVAVPEKAIPPTVTGEFVLSGGGPGTSNMFATPPSVSLTTSPAFVSVGGVETFPSGNHTGFPVPAGVSGVATQIVIVAFYVEDSSTIITPPAGFTEVGGSPVDAPLYNIRAYWKRPTAADTGIYDFGFDALTGIQGRALLFSGCVSSGDPIEGGIGFVDVDASFTSTPGASTTTSGPSRRVVWIVADGANSGVTFPGGWTEHIDIGYLAVASAPVSVAGLVPASGSLVANTGLASQASVWLGALRST